MDSVEKPTRSGGEQQRVRRPESATTVEDIVESLDRDRHEADKAALEHGPGKDLAAALAAELGTQVQLEERVAQEQGVEAHRQWKREVEEDNAAAGDRLELAMELNEYAQGKGELSDEARQKLQERVDQINAELDKLEETKFSTQTISRLRGAEDPYDVAMIAERYRELSELRRGEERPILEGAQESIDPPEEEASSPEADRFRRTYEAAQIEGSLDRDPGMYTDAKGAELVVKVMKELGMGQAEMAAFAKTVATKYEQLADSAKTIHEGKSEQAQGMWAENQLTDSLKGNPVWERINQAIEDQGNSLAGMNSRISRNKVMSSFLKLARNMG